mgnify:CR=1 FL=1
MPHKRLFIPGPTEVRTENLAALARPQIGHRSQELKDLYAGVEADLQPLARRLHPRVGRVGHDIEHHVSGRADVADGQHAGRRQPAQGLVGGGDGIEPGGLGAGRVALGETQVAGGFARGVVPSFTNVNTPRDLEEISN